MLPLFLFMFPLETKMADSNQDIVWRGEQAELAVYLYNEDTEQPTDFILGNLDLNGNSIVDPVVNYCYIRNVTIESKGTYSRRAVTGRGRRKIVRRSGTNDEVSISSNHLVFRKSESWKPATIFNNWTMLYLVLLLDDFPNRQTIFSVKRCRAEAFSIQSEDENEIVASINFIGEELI